MCNVKCKAHKLQVGTMSIMVGQSRDNKTHRVKLSWQCGSLRGKWVVGRDEDILFIKQDNCKYNYSWCQACSIAGLKKINKVNTF